MASPEGGSTDVFVSYSRSDQEFVRALVAALAAQEKKAWVDWEAIPPTAEWLAEIHAAIETSDAFLFVISPDSSSSTMCREELAHAEQLGKRIIPVNVRLVDPADLPPVLAELQWITFGDGRSFDRSVEELVETLDTDLEWVREHTHWLAKAREWERSGRDRSFLLRGSELRAAESWLTTPGAAAKEPPATPLQNEFVFAGRLAAIRRQRALVAAVAVALLVTIALALAALLQRNRALSERRTAVSQLLASLSLQYLGTDLDTALLLGAAAYDTKRTPEAKRAVLAGGQRSRHVAGLLRALDGGVTAADVSEDGSLLAAASGTRLVLWDVPRRTPRATVATRKPVDALVLDPQGSLVATVEASRVLVRETGASGRTVSQAQMLRTRPVSLAFSPESGLLAIGTEDGRVVFLDVARDRLGTGFAVERPPAYEGLTFPIRPLVFTPDGSRLAAGSPTGLHVLDVERRPRYEAMYESPGVRSLAFLGDDLIAVVSEVGRLIVVDAESGRAVCSPVRMGLRAVHADSGGRLVLGGDNGAIRVAPAPCRGPSVTLGDHGNDVRLVRFVDPRSRLVSIDADGLAVIWAPDRALSTRLSPGDGLASDVQWGWRRGELLVANTAGVWRVRRGTRPVLLSQTQGFSATLAVADAAKVLVANSGGLIRVWRGLDYAAASTVAGGPGVSVALRADGLELAAGTSDGRVEIRTGRAFRRKEPSLRTGAGDPVTALAYGDGDSLLAAGDSRGRLVVWKERVRERIRVFPRKVEALAFSRDGALLAVGLSDGTLVVSDAHGRTETALPLHHGEAVSDLAFSPDGERLLSVDAAGTLLVWDVSSARPLGPAFATGLGSVEALELSASRELAVLGRSGAILLVPRPLWDDEAARARVCQLVGRSLTEAEWRSVVTELPAPETCAPDGEVR